VFYIYKEEEFLFDIRKLKFVPEKRRYLIKGTVSVISRDPPGKEGNVRFTTVSFQPLTDQ